MLHWVLATLITSWLQNLVSYQSSNVRLPSLRSCSLDIRGDIVLLNKYAHIALWKSTSILNDHSKDDFSCCETRIFHFKKHGPRESLVSFTTIIVKDYVTRKFNPTFQYKYLDKVKAIRCKHSLTTFLNHNCSRTFFY